MNTTQFPLVSQLVEGANILFDGFIFLPLPQASESTGRKTTILTQHALCAGAWLGVITTVASIALGNLAVTLAALVYGLTALTASYFVRETYTLRSIDQDIATLRDANKRLGDALEQYKKDLKDLQDSVTKLHTENTSLAKENVDAKKASDETAASVKSFEQENVNLRKTVATLQQLPIELAKELNMFGGQIAQIQAATTLVDDKIEKALAETGKNVAAQTQLLKDATQGNIDAAKFLEQSKALFNNISKLYGQSLEALKATVEAEQKISDEFKKWQIDELAATQDQMAKILEELNKNLDEAFKQLKPTQMQSSLSGDHAHITTPPVIHLSYIEDALKKAMTARDQLKDLLQKSRTHTINQVAINEIKK